MSERRKELDGLRAISIIPVILFHSNEQIFTNGYLGVDIFFLLSGYLITNLLISDLENGTFKLRQFYQRRIRRLFPAWLAATIFTMIVSLFLLTPMELVDYSKSLLATVTLTSNIYFWRNTDYFDLTAISRPLLHTWSLSLEEQFYIIAPILLMLVARTFRKSPRDAILVTLFFVFSLSYIFAKFISQISPGAEFYLLPSRAWELALGGIIALASHKRKKLGSIHSHRLLSSVGLMVVIHSIFISSFVQIKYLHSTEILLAGVTLLILFTTSEKGAGKLLSNPILVKIGLFSYSAYLWHWPIIVFARIMNPNLNAFIKTFLILILTFTISAVSYFVIENPIRYGSFKNNFKLNTLIIVFVLTLGTFSIWVVTQDGLDSRFRAMHHGNIGHELFHTYLERKYIDCQSREIKTNSLSWNGILRCKQSKAGTPDLILLGDSHAEHLFIGVTKALPNRNVAYYIQGGRPYLENSSFKSIFDELLGNGIAQQILISYDFNNYQDVTIGLHNSLRNTVKELIRSGKEVYLISDVPTFPFSAEQCKFQISFQNEECSFETSDYNSQLRKYNKVLTEISKEFGILYIDIGDLFCNSISCSMIKENEILFRDSNHLNVKGSYLVGSFIVKEIDNYTSHGIKN